MDELRRKEEKLVVEVDSLRERLEEAESLLTEKEEEMGKDRIVIQRLVQDR